MNNAKQFMRGQARFAVTTSVWTVCAFYMLWPTCTEGQVIDGYRMLNSKLRRATTSVQPATAPTTSSKGDGDKPFSILSGGFIDLLTNGAVQASTQFMKVYIGEPTGFHVPIFVYTGASTNAFSSPKTNISTISSILNPVGGLGNISAQASGMLWHYKKEGSATNLSYSLHGGYKITSGVDTLKKVNDRLSTLFLQGGLLFQTKAWTDTTTTNPGLFYIQARGGFHYFMNQDLLQDVFATKFHSNWLLNYNVDIVLDLSSKIKGTISIMGFMGDNANMADPLKSAVVKFSGAFQIPGLTSKK